MAEIIAGVSIASSFIQLVDFGTKVVSRLHDYRSDFQELPKVFRDLHIQLPLLLRTIEALRSKAESSTLPGLKDHLVPILDGCKNELQSLDQLLTDLLPVTNSWREKLKKASRSIFQESKLERMHKTLRQYTDTLMFYSIAEAQNGPSTLGEEVDTQNEATEAEMERIRRWVKGPDPHINYQSALNQRLDKTGSWFLEGNEYQNWKAQDKSLLWVNGIPGSGKSVLSASIIEDVQQSRPGLALAFFYFSFNDPEKQLFDSFCRSIFQQLTRQALIIPKPIKELFRSCTSGRRTPTVYELVKVLGDLVGAFPGCYLIVDALDESSEPDNVLRLLKDLWSRENIPHLHILMTSRKERDIELSLSGFVADEDCVSLQTKSVDEDIRRYVQYCWDHDPKFKKWRKNSELKAQVEKSLMLKASGMFRWASCQMDELRKCINVKQLRNALVSLPKDLDETYERILCGIEEQNREYALRVLRWLAFANSTLTTLEVAEIVAIDAEGEGAFDKDEVLSDPEDIIALCSSLVTIRESAVVLAHYSVQEYLVSSRACQGPAKHFALEARHSNAIVACGCLMYLLHLADGSMHDLKKLKLFYPLALYSARQWWTHASQASESCADRICILANKLDGNYRGFTICLSLHDPDDNNNQGRRSTNEKPTPELLYHASCAGIIPLIRQLMSAGANVNHAGGYLGTSLQAAIVKKHSPAVKMLLAGGAHVDVCGGRYGSVLNAACATNSENIVQQLIVAGADVNLQADTHGSPLQVACCTGSDKVLQLLLKAGANSRGVQSFADRSILRLHHGCRETPRG
ncbi:hypothetical protein BT63DRAFT_292722 [Microthyrium microscopicum]|uniref:NACHT domain-containing protein n=1 Tax=Microthyrium microscopicum TaxID=703497 RepID=A0A6A6U7P5_9PEZI|nr:hypothetical protein BT63DRAFT_292722 [Microthyrium microscopicum]